MMLEEKTLKCIIEAYRTSISKGFSIVRTSILLKKIYEVPDNIFYKFCSFNNVDDEVEIILSDIIEAEQIEMDVEDVKENVEFSDEEVIMYINFEEELIEILNKISQENIITVDAFFYELVKIAPWSLVELMREFNIEYKDLEEFVKNNIKSEDKDKIPPYLEGILTLKNAVIQEGPKRILGRDKEMKTIWNILSKKTKSNVILVGEPGVGKTAIAELMVYEIVNHKCPKQFEDYQVIQLDINNLIAGTTHRGMAEERFAEIKDLLEENMNIILFIDEIHMMLGAGACSGNYLDFANSMKPLLASDKVKVVGATTFDEYKWFAQDGALARRFEVIEVKEPKHSEVYQMIKGRIEELKEYHNVKISKKMVEYIILQASCFYNNIANPDRSLDFIDKAMATAKIREAKVVTMTDINKVLDVNLKAYRLMSVEDKMAIAYHEAGHCILAVLSNYNKIVDTVALSIMPTSDYLGVTVHDPKEENFWTPYTEEIFIDKIAVFLAGRVSEKMYTKKLSSGASSDLEYANELAREVVTSYSMGENSNNRIYFYEDLMSEETINHINKEIENLLIKAEKRAEEIIYANMPLLKALVNALIKKGILNKKELDKIFSDYSKVKS